MLELWEKNKFGEISLGALNDDLFRVRIRYKWAIIPYMFENPRRGRQARNFTTNIPKILDLKSFSEQIFSKIDVGCPWYHCGSRKSACPHCLKNRFLHHYNLMDHFTIAAWWTDFIGQVWVRVGINNIMCLHMFALVTFLFRVSVVGLYEGLADRG